MAPGTGSCELRPLGKKPLGFWGRSLSCHSMSGRYTAGAAEMRAAKAKQADHGEHAGGENGQESSALVLHPFDVLAAGLLEQLAGFGFRVLRVRALDDHEKAVVGDQ